MFFNLNRDILLDVRLKVDGNFVSDVVLLRVSKGDLVDMMLESGEFGDESGLNPIGVCVEDWSDYNVNYDMETGEWEAFSGRVLKVQYSCFRGGVFGGGTWEFNGDYIGWFRDRRISELGL